MNLAEFPQIQALSVPEKMELMDEIWKSTSAHVDALEVSKEEKQLLDERWTNFLAQPESALSIEQFNEKLKQLRS